MELPHIGQHCVICNRNDYLPFKCKHCDKTICIDHKFNHGSDCSISKTNFQTNPEVSRFPESLKGSCHHCNKITLKLELVECPECQGKHCLYHRHQIQHNCPKLVERGETYVREAEKRLNKQKDALLKLKERLKSSQPTSATQKPSTSIQSTDTKKLELAKRVRIMRLKQSARGPPNILQEDKVYFEVRFRHEPQSLLSDASKHDTSIKIYTSPKHTLGRMIDWSSDQFRLVNKNHMLGVSQMVFKKINETGEPEKKLDSQQTFSHYLSNGELENGDELVLTYDLV